MPEGVSGPVEPRLHRSHGQPDDLADLLVAHALDVEEDEELPMVGREPHQSAMHQVSRLPTLRLPVRAKAGVGWLGDRSLLVIALVQGDLPAPTAPPQTVEARVVEDTVKPGAEGRLLLELPEGAPRGDESLLGGIVGRVEIAQHPVGEADGARLVPPHQRVEGSEVAIPAQPHQLRVGSFLTHGHERLTVLQGGERSCPQAGSFSEATA